MQSLVFLTYLFFFKIIEEKPLGGGGFRLGKGRVKRPETKNLKTSG